MTEYWKFHRLIDPYGHRVKFHDENRESHRSEQPTSFAKTQKSTVFDLVYKYLRKCADRDMRRKQRNCAYNKFHRQHARRKDIRVRDGLTSHVSFRQSFDNENLTELKSDKNMSAKRTVKKKRCTANYGNATARNIGSKHAKCYIKQALLYGLQSGLLIPTDQQNMLRVSRKLRHTCLSKNAERNKSLD